LSALGSMAAALMFLITLSLLFSTPGVIAPGYSFPVLSANVGQFVIKDLVLLGASIWTAGERRSLHPGPHKPLRCVPPHSAARKNVWSWLASSKIKATTHV